MQRAVKDIYVDPLIKQYIVSIVDATRKHGSVYLGASPRGSLALYRTCQARALLDGRDFVVPDDVKELAYATLGHRIIVSPSARVKNVTREGDRRADARAHPGAGRARAAGAAPAPTPAARRRARQRQAMRPCVARGLFRALFVTNRTLTASSCCWSCMRRRSRSRRASG